MTTIIGIQGDGYSLVCSDSRISAMDDGGFASQVITLREGTGKVALNGKYLLGAAGDMRAINILHHVFQPPQFTTSLKGKKLDQFITSKFVPALRDCFEKQGYAVPTEKETSSHLAEHGSTVMVSVNGSIYIVDGDYSWTADATGIYAMGTGSPYALGALQALVSNKTLTPAQAKKVALKAISIAAKNDPYTGSPFHCYIQEEE
jgi:ATP-dependent protease HslVU (ClpYQ) peptidase subunit